MTVSAILGFNTVGFVFVIVVVFSQAKLFFLGKNIWSVKMRDT